MQSPGHLVKHGGSGSASERGAELTFLRSSQLIPMTLVCGPQFEQQGARQGLFLLILLHLIVSEHSERKTRML